MVIQVYAPTADKPEMEVLNFYKDIENALKFTKEGLIIIIRNLNAKGGRGRCEDIVSDFGLDNRIERGDN